MNAEGLNPQLFIRSPVSLWIEAYPYPCPHP